MDRTDLDKLTQERLKKLLATPQQDLAEGDIAFLWARKPYLLKEEVERFQEVFDAYEKEHSDYDGDSEKTEGDPEEKPLVEYTRPELDQMAKDLYGIEKPEELANKGEVIKAIETAKASKAE